MRLKYPAPLRSSMSLMTNVVRERHPITRNDVIEKIEKQRAAKEIIDEERAKFRPKNIRFAVAKKDGNDYHVIGLGKVEAKSLDELKKIVIEKGYTDLKLKGKIYKL